MVVGDKFISLTNKTKNPVVSAEPHSDFDYEKNRWKEGFGPGSPLHNQAGDGRA